MWLIKRNDATAYPDGTRIKSKVTGKTAIIDRECKCGDWLHYEIRFDNDEHKHASVFQHKEIQDLFEVIE